MADDYPYRWDPEDALTPEERLGFELISSLEGRLVTDDAFRASERAQKQLVAELHQEIDTARVAAKYSQRTWSQFLVASIVLIGNLRDVAATYDGVWWALAFPLSSHAGGPWWLELWLRVTGALWEAALLAVMFKRARVPPWLQTRLPRVTMTEQEFREKYDRGL